MACLRPIPAPPRLSPLGCPWLRRCRFRQHEGNARRSGEHHGREGRRCKGISSERIAFVWSPDVPRPRVGAGRATTRRTKSPCSDGPRPKRSFCPCSGGPRPKIFTAAERLLTRGFRSGSAKADPCPPLNWVKNQKTRPGDCRALWSCSLASDQFWTFSSVRRFSSLLQPGMVCGVETSGRLSP